MVERSVSCSGETLLAPCKRKERLQRKIRELKQHDAVMKRRLSIARSLFKQNHASLITDPI